MKELTLSELTVEQKLGMLLTATFPHGQEDEDYTMQMIREHRLGSVYVNPDVASRDRLIQRIREAADYPIIITGDAENGFGDYVIPQQISISGAGGADELAYSFGKATAVQLHALGYDTISSPVVDFTDVNSPCGAVCRAFAPTREDTARLAVAYGRGMHDGGMMVMPKHYPGYCNFPVDTHMQEARSALSERKLLKKNLYPYLKMNEAGVLDAIMNTHIRMENIDPEYPATLSKKVLDIIRRHGFRGFFMTDAMTMMGIVLKYGQYDCNGLAAAAGNEAILSWGIPNKDAYEAIVKAYREGKVPDALLDESVGRILEAQHKALLNREIHAEITAEDVENVRRINEDSVCLHADADVNPTIDKNGKHLFVVLTEIDFNEKEMEDAPISNAAWYNPAHFRDKILATYPNSQVKFLRYYPTAGETAQLFVDQIEYDDVVYVTYWKTCAYLGKECLTSRVLAGMESLQTTKRIAAVVNFGNPFLMEDIPHVPRVVFAYCSTRCVEHAFDVLCGNAPARGVMPFKKLKLKK